MKMKLKPKQLHRSLALPPNKDAPLAKKPPSKNHQCSWRTGANTVALQSDPFIFLLWGQGGRWTPPACIQDAPIWINRTGWTPPATHLHPRRPNQRRTRPAMPLYPRASLELLEHTPHCTNRCLASTNHKKVTLAAVPH